MDISNIKDKYTRKMQAKLDQLSAEIEVLSAQADHVEAQARVEYQKQIDTLYRKKEEVRNRLTELENSGESAWEDMKSEVETAWDNVGKAVNSAKSRFK